ncbi:hypothetical protein Nlim_1300 [Candidatus Nitrosarchaeum limnium SFB1]|jgi:hypothetical protein|uniref:Uncharacterized protein n=1 Tax=Candidatus Nitrosarchaeum limnium SFB1 TaxID=886738 RepID=F3KLC1_9ARCH|nr:hypothetical protein Nlim_1300 [Candidatus Nitrosarchaeum limnium SFB1]
MISCNLKNVREWKQYCKSGYKPDDIPSHPELYYKSKGWKGFGDWLGTENPIPNQNFRNFDEAKSFVHSLKLKNFKEWQQYCNSGKRPNDIPARPEKYYKLKGWISWGNWLGTEITSRTRNHQPFSLAKEFVHHLELKNVEEWYEFCKSSKKPKDIPSNPDKKYRNMGWNGYKDWLGTNSKIKMLWA